MGLDSQFVQKAQIFRIVKAHMIDDSIPPQDRYYHVKKHRLPSKIEILICKERNPIPIHSIVVGVVTSSLAFLLALFSWPVCSWKKDKRQAHKVLSCKAFHTTSLELTKRKTRHILVYFCVSIGAECLPFCSSSPACQVLQYQYYTTSVQVRYGNGRFCFKASLWCAENELLLGT